MSVGKIDILNRDEIIEDLFNIVQSASINKAYCSFAIEGIWGVGKTFVLQKLEEKLEEQLKEETADNRYFYFTIIVGNTTIMRNRQ